MKGSNPAEELSKELNEIKSDNLFSTAYRKKKLVIWTVRTLLAVVLYVVFWKHEWVRWSLFLYVPLNAFGLLSIFGTSYFLNKKMERTSRKIEELNKTIANK